MRTRETKILRVLVCSVTREAVMARVYPHVHERWHEERNTNQHIPCGFKTAEVGAAHVTDLVEEAQSAIQGERSEEKPQPHACGKGLGKQYEGKASPASHSAQKEIYPKNCRPRLMQVLY
jgi:hypothetical protein